MWGRSPDVPVWRDVIQHETEVASDQDGRENDTCKTRVSGGARDRARLACVNDSGPTPTWLSFSGWATARLSRLQSREPGNSGLNAESRGGRGGGRRADGVGDDARLAFLAPRENTLTPVYFVARARGSGTDLSLLEHQVGIYGSTKHPLALFESEVLDDFNGTELDGLVRISNDYR